MELMHLRRPGAALVAVSYWIVVLFDPDQHPRPGS